MEAGTIQNNKTNLFFAEFFGTLLFMTTIFYSSVYHTNLFVVAVGVGLGNFIANVAFGTFTGGHFNPSVSIGYFLFIQPEKRRHFQTLLVLIAAQFFGGLGGGFLLFIVAGFRMPVLIPQVNNLLGSYVNEIFFSFMLFTVIYCVKNNKHNDTIDSVLNWLTCAITIIGVILYGGKTSGACYNPAVGFTITFWASLAEGHHEYYKNLVLYFVAPTIGACFAGFFVRYYIDQEFLKDDGKIKKILK